MKNGVEPVRDTQVPPVARALGAAGLLPQLACVLVLLLLSPEAGFAAQALGFAYASLILSFLGGLWWGLAAAHRDAPRWLYVAAVAPSLIALACAVPWALGWPWPGPSLIVLASAIWGSLIVDRRLSRDGMAPGWWMQLRLPLSGGLGLLTLAIGLMA